MKRVTGLAVAFLLALSVSATAGRKDDFDFAQGLVQRKYYDLAREQFERIVKDPSRSSEEKAEGELGLAMLLKAQADEAKTDPRKPVEEVLKLFEQAEAGFDKFLTTYARHPRLTEAKFLVGQLLQAKGDFLSKRISEDPALKDKYEKLAEDAFDAAIDLFDQSRSDLEEKLDGLDERDPRYPTVEWAAKRAAFFHAVVHYYKGILYPPESAERQGVLGKFLKLIEDFEWDNEENLLGGYGYLYWGLAYKELDNPREAVDKLKIVSDYPIPPDDADTGGFWTDLILQGYFKLGEYCNEVGRRDGIDYRDICIAKFKEMMEKIPDVFERKFGCFALLQYAKALAGTKQVPAALDLAQKVSEQGDKLAASTEWGAAIAFLANRVINDIIIEQGGEVTLPAATLMKAARGVKSSRNWPKAIRAFQKVVFASRSPEDVEAYAIPAWMEIGECFYRREEFLEAYFAYDHVMKTAKDRTLAGDAAYYRYRAAAARFAVTKDKRDEDLKKKTRNEFATRFADHPKAKDLQYYEGADFITDGDARSYQAGNAEARGDAAGAAKLRKVAEELYAKALARLLATPKTSVLYAKARARVGEVQQKLGKYAEALATFREVEKYVTDPKNVTTDPQRKANRLQALAISVYFSALCYSKTERWSEVLRVLDGYEKRFSDENVRDFHAPVAFERVRALIRTGRLAEAEQAALAMRKRFPADVSPRTPIAFGLLGQACYQAALSARKAKDDEGYRSNLRKAADYYAYAVAHRSKPSADDWMTIGAWYKDLGRLEKAEEYLEKSLSMFQARRKAMSDRTPEAEEVDKRIGQITEILADILLKLEKYAQAKKFFEELLIPDPSARARVRQLLEQPEHTKDSLRELMAKIRAVPSFMVGLARAYEAGGTQKEYVRAVTLLQVLSRANRGDKFTEKWWYWQYLIIRIYYEFGESFQSQQAYDNCIAKYEGYRNLGVIRPGETPYGKEIEEIARKARLAKAKLLGGNER